MVQPNIWNLPRINLLFLWRIIIILFSFLLCYFSCRQVYVQEKFCTSKCKNQKVLSSIVACIYSFSAPKFRPLNGTFISFTWQFYSRFNIMPFLFNINSAHSSSYYDVRLVNQILTFYLSFFCLNFQASIFLDFRATRWLPQCAH